MRYILPLSSKDPVVFGFIESEEARFLKVDQIATSLTRHWLLPLEWGLWEMICRVKASSLLGDKRHECLKTSKDVEAVVSSQMIRTSSAVAEMDKPLRSQNKAPDVYSHYMYIEKETKTYTHLSKTSLGRIQNMAPSSTHSPLIGFRGAHMDKSAVPSIRCWVSLCSSYRVFPKSTHTMVYRPGLGVI